jgi:hypothetical protein
MGILRYWMGGKRLWRQILDNSSFSQLSQARLRGIEYPNGYLNPLLSINGNSHYYSKTLTTYLSHVLTKTKSNETNPQTNTSKLKTPLKMAGLLGNLTNSVDNTLTGGDEAQGKGGLLGSVTGAVGQTVDGAGQAVGQTTRGVGNIAGGATNTVGGLVEGATGQGGQAAQGAAGQGQQAAQGVAGQTRNA